MFSKSHPILRKMMEFVPALKQTKILCVFIVIQESPQETKNHLIRFPTAASHFPDYHRYIQLRPGICWNPSLDSVSLHIQCPALDKVFRTEVLLWSGTQMWTHHLQDLSPYELPDPHTQWPMDIKQDRRAMSSWSLNKTLAHKLVFRTQESLKIYFLHSLTRWVS